jgi:hypothetical protein
MRQWRQAKNRLITSRPVPRNRGLLVMTTKIHSSLLACAGVQALAAVPLWAVSTEVRAHRLFAEAQQPQAERTTLDEYQGSAPDRGRMQYPVGRIHNPSFAAGDALGRPAQLAHPVSAASARA